MLPSLFIEILLYEREDGLAPFEAWFDDLDHTAAAKVTIAIERLRAGNFSNVKSVGSGLQELRIHWGPGYRLYFGRDGEKLVILLAGERSSVRMRISSKQSAIGPTINDGGYETWR